MVDAGNETDYNMGTTTAHPMDDAFENAIEEVIDAFYTYRDTTSFNNEDVWLELLKADPKLSALNDAINALADLAYADE